MRCGENNGQYGSSRARSHALSIKSRLSARNVKANLSVLLKRNIQTFFRRHRQLTRCDVHIIFKRALYLGDTIFRSAAFDKNMRVHWLIFINCKLKLSLYIHSSFRIYSHNFCQNMQSRRPKRYRRHEWRRRTHTHSGDLHNCQGTMWCGWFLKFVRNTNRNATDGIYEHRDKSDSFAYI